MLLTTMGVVIGERAYGENDKFIDIFTKDHGIIEVTVKGGRKLNSKNSASTGLFSYSKFCVNKRGERYYLNSSEIENTFYDLRFDIKKLALASYFAELLKYTVLSYESDESYEIILKLLLNTLYYLEKGTHDIMLLKSIFELRLLSEIGLIPNLIGCSVCNVYLHSKMHFDIQAGKLYCDNCFSGVDGYNIIAVNETTVSALRHIALSDLNILFNIKVSDRLLKEINKISDRYVFAHINRNFKTLEYFKSIFNSI